MKHLYTLILLFCVPLLNMSAQECSPTFNDFYNFEAGSVFQYHTIKNSGAGGNISNTHIIERYMVTEKWTENDTLRYIREGTRQHYTEYEINFEPIRKYTEDFKDTIVIVDSSKHFLNACDSQLVKVRIENDFYSRVYLDTLDGIPGKGIGGYVDGSNNLYEYNDQDSLIEVLAYEYEEVALKGIGLNHRYELFFESSENKDLEGYVFNGDTVGTIWSDKDFITSVNIPNQSENVKVYPTVLNNNTFYVENGKRLTQLNVFSLDGRLQPFQKITDNEFRLSQAMPGTYLVVVYFDRNTSVNRLVVPKGAP